MSGNNKSEKLATEILRQIMRMENTRALRAQPAFAIDKNVPAKFYSLLDAIDEAERRHAGRRH